MVDELGPSLQLFAELDVLAHELGLEHLERACHRSREKVSGRQRGRSPKGGDLQPLVHGGLHGRPRRGLADLAQPEEDRGCLGVILEHVQPLPPFLGDPLDLVDQRGANPVRIERDDIAEGVRVHVAGVAHQDEGLVGIGIENRGESDCDGDRLRNHQSLSP